jgi:LytS/YehU family sensor histidine kinase
VRKLSTEARLSSLESRVHPHFLFNTLNSISSLIRDDPKAAERTVERLAALLRYSLDSNGARLVPLRQELCVVRDYLEIEQTRYGGRLRYQINAPVELEDSEVPPFALQTLVENSVKHVVSENRQGAEISVTVRRRGTDLLLEVADDGPGFDPAAIPQGRGLDNLRGRLAGIFESQGHLDISHGEGRTVVSVTVPLKRVPA